MRALLLSILVLSISLVRAQHVEPTPADLRLSAYEQKLRMPSHPLVEALDFRSVGPVIMSGRVTDVDVNPENTDEFYVAYASGGLWKTEDRGADFTPLFDFQPTMSMGDIAVDWAHGETIWVGTGENNSSRSSYAGIGVFKSTDGGKTWMNMGLNETNHIGRIVVHPDNPDIVWVAAMGHLYSQNPERGVFKTVDGGRTWEKTLFVNSKTGAIDLVINPKDPDVLYAAMWERQAWRWDRHENGPGSGIYKSTDGGKSWEKINRGENGFPEGPYVGRIGLALYPEDPGIVYAYLDNQTPVPSKKKSKTLYEPEDFRDMSEEEFYRLDPDEFNKFIKKSRYPEWITYDFLRKGIEQGRYSPGDLLTYKRDTNLIPPQDVTGVEIYRTGDGGDSWQRTHRKNFTGPLMSYSYGYYFGEIRVFPDDPDKIIVGGLVISRSKSGGRRLWRQIRGNVHFDHHAFWIHPEDPDFILNGNDGGLNLSTNGGRSWEKINTIPVGQFYSIHVDMETPYNIYGGLQDNGVWMGPSTYDIEKGYERTRRKYPYKSIMGGDGMQVQTAESEGLWVYCGSQFGRYVKQHFIKKPDGSYKKKGKSKRLHPRHRFGQPVNRFNWQTPILVSQHADSVFYMGSQRMYRSMNRGAALKAVSGALPQTVMKGDISNGTVTAIDESPMDAGVVYAGTDDGLVWVTTDSCGTWTNISEGLPAGYRIYSIDASAFARGRAYVAMNGYYSDNFEALIFKTEDFGKTWEKISGGLPMEPVNKVVEDPVNSDLLYVGTDHGLYISLDRGKTYHLPNRTFPYAPVHDIVVHPRENDLLVATHGRSIYRVNVARLQKADLLKTSF